MRNAGLTIIAAVVIMLSAHIVLFLAPDPVSGDGTRFTPEIARGQITTDQTWDGTFYTKNIVIREGVTVNITAGSIWRHPQDSFTFVEGTLLVEGTDENPVVIEELVSGQGWDGINVNYTGRIVFKNFTISGVDNGEAGITLVSASSWMENGTISGGGGGIVAGEAFGGHTILNVDFFEQRVSAISFIGNLYPTLIKGIRTFDTDLYAISIGMAESITLQDIEIYRTKGVGVLISAYQSGFTTSDITFNNVTIIGSETTPTAYGISFDQDLENIRMDDVDIDHCGFGVGIRSYPGSDASINDLWIGSGVAKGIFQGQTDHGLDLTITNSTINSSPDIMDLVPEGSNTTVNLIDTFWKESSNIGIEGGGTVIVHWSSDVRVVEGRGEPADVRIELFDDMGTSLYSRRRTDGVVKDIIFKSMVMKEDSDRKVKHDVHVSVSSNPENELWMNDTWVNRSTSSVFIQLDLWPESTLAPVFYLDEDEGLTMDLYYQFEDPDDDLLDFEVWTGPELEAELIGGSGSGILNVSIRENWVGQTWMRIRASDPRGNFTEVNSTVEVMQVNDPPLVDEPFPVFVVPEDTPLSINMSEYFVDLEGDPINYNVLELDNATYSWDEAGTNLTIFPVMNWFGMLSVEINASDGKLWSHEVIPVNVTPANDPPV
ncbi:MAG: hypothetical protein ACMUHB_03965, partial [Thermoplasmatota archaeon]